MERELRPPTSVGEIIVQEFLKPLELSQTALAKHLKWTQPKVNEIIQGKRGLTPETALDLADAFGTSPDFWLNAQRAMDLWKARKKHTRLTLLPQLKMALASKTVKHSNAIGRTTTKSSRKTHKD